MKAVIMAGGFGTRLMPVTAIQPKPMLKICDKPIIQYTLELLKKHNITDACLTLGYLPNEIKNFVTENSGFGLNVSCIVEDTPMGTAGSVKQCKNFIGNDDFIVISGDAICDFDLTECIDRHYASGAQASIVLYSHPEPLEFGLVNVNENNKICGFIEKPSWDRVETNLVNTGIYILDNKLLDRIPDNIPWDFGKDVFPSLLNEDFPLYGFEAKGYWCDVGCPKAYHKCVQDILSGKTGLSIPEAAPVYSDFTIIPPVYISKAAHISEGAVIGPNSVIGKESTVGKNSKVSDSIIDGAVLLPDCTVCGSIMCRGSQSMQGTRISEGCIVGAEAIIGSRSVLLPEISIWPRQKIKAGQLVNKSIVSGSLRGWPKFSATGTMFGEYNSTLTPEICFALGAACAKIGKTGISCAMTPASETLASSLACGISAAGGKAFMIDIPFASGAAYTGHILGFDITVFISESDGETEIIFTDQKGLPISRETERKLEAVFSGSRKIAAANSTEAASDITGSVQLYSTAVRRKSCFDLRKISVKLNVLGSSIESDTLRTILEELGCELVNNNYGIPVFELYNGGTRLRARDEFGHEINWKHLLCVLTIIELECGSGKTAVPFEAPKALDEIAQKFGNKILRPGRDEGANELYVDESWLHDGIFAAVRIAAGMAKLNSSLTNLVNRIPVFSTVTREISLSEKRGDVMKRLGFTRCFSHDGGAGLLYSSEIGCARVRPASNREALVITSECATIEAAEELCGNIRNIIEGKL